MPDWATWTGAVGTWVSAGVLAAGLRYTYVQLKHLRYANELATMTKMAELYDSSPVQKSRNFVIGPLAELMQDHAFRLELASMPMGRRAEKIKPIANFYEDLGTYVLTGAISEKIALLLYGQTVTEAWSLLADPLMVVRRKRRTLWAEFEYLAGRAQKWHETKEFQESSRRLRSPNLDPWRDIDLKLEAQSNGPGVPATGQ